MIVIIQSLLLFLPAYYANMCPGFAAGLKLPGNSPISKRWLGGNKTWRGHMASLAGGVFMAALLHCFIPIFPHGSLHDLYEEHWVALGLTMGIGAKLGDDIKSFIKRRLGKEPGARWFPFDQVDYILGAIALSMPLTGWLGWGPYSIVVLPTILLHGVCARRAFRKGQKTRPY